ncbi:MAG: ABC transporter ATP-binding protein [Thermoplasmata archaeon]
MTVFIAAEGLTRTFSASRPAVEDLTFQIQRGEIFALLGPNGAGKTTTIRLLAGLISPTSGAVYVDGMDLRDAAQLTEVHRRIGILPETPGLYESLTAYRNLQFFGRLNSMAPADLERRIHQLLEEFELWDRRDERISTFSKGMKQKVAIARAMLHDPECFILDEPISGLDPEAAKVVRDYIIRLRSQGRTILLSTHNLDDADRLSDRVAVLRSRLLALDSPAELKRRLFRPTIDYQFVSLDDATTAAVRSFPSVRDVRRSGNQLFVQLDDPDRDNPALLAMLIGRGAHVQYVERTAHSLEEVYLKLVDDDKAQRSTSVPLASGAVA